MPHMSKHQRRCKNTENNKNEKYIMVNKKEEVLDVNEKLEKSEAFIAKYKKPIAIGVAAVVVIVVAAILYNVFISAPRADKASTALAKGQEYFGNEQFDKALNGDGATYAGFVKIADDYSGTDAANLANLYAGLCYANLGKWANAVTYLEKYSEGSDMMVSPAAHAALGNAYAQTGNIDKAISCLKKAADMADSKADDKTNNSLAPTFLMQAGKLLESQNKKADALKIYQDVKAKYVNSAIVQSSEIDKYIERVSE